MQDDQPRIFASLTDFSDSKRLNVGWEALDPASIQAARQLACLQPGHPWSNFQDLEILESEGLVSGGFSGEPCKLTAAALLLFGRPSVLREVFPERHIEVTAQLLDPQGYDFRENLQGNLMEAYARLVSFVAQNFPEGEALPGLGSSRDVLFGEILSNLVVHRDYSWARPARIVFQRDRHTFENPARPRKGGLVDLAWFDSRPQNPLLYRFFVKMGAILNPARGLRNLLKYGEAYFGTQILAFDRDIFKVIATSSLEFPVPRSITADTGETLPPGSMESSAMQATVWKRPEAFGVVPLESRTTMQVQMAMQVESGPESAPVHQLEGYPERTRRILSFCESPRNREEIQKHVGLNNRDHFRKEVLLPLLQKGLLQATLPDKPNSPKQQYRTAPAFVSREP